MSKPVIPVKLSECKVHPRLEPTHYVRFSSYPRSLPWADLIKRLKQVEEETDSAEIRPSQCLRRTIQQLTLKQLTKLRPKFFRTLTRRVSRWLALIALEKKLVRVHRMTFSEQSLPESRSSSVERRLRTTNQELGNQELRREFHDQELLVDLLRKGGMAQIHSA